MAELIVTLVLFGLMAATLVVFLKPAVDSWLAVQRDEGWLDERMSFWSDPANWLK